MEREFGVDAGRLEVDVVELEADAEVEGTWEGAARVPSACSWRAARS